MRFLIKKDLPFVFCAEMRVAIIMRICRFDLPYRTEKTVGNSWKTSFYARGYNKKEKCVNYCVNYFAKKY